jgi:hypothetical protein
VGDAYSRIFGREKLAAPVKRFKSRYGRNRQSKVPVTAGLKILRRKQIDIIFQPILPRSDHFRLHVSGAMYTRPCRIHSTTNPTFWDRGGNFLYQIREEIEKNVVMKSLLHPVTGLS